MKLSFVASFLLFGAAPAAVWSFMPTSLTQRPVTAVRMSMVSDRVDTDLKIPYDAAARLAYDDWCAKYNKKYDEARFATFKSNYEAISVANVSAKKKARDEGTESPALMTLNEFGDCTEEEYRALSSKGATTSTGDVLGKALDAAQSQSEASSALKDAADALAEEEEALAKKLGLESVEELEIALDSMEGIAADGGELDQENIAREARIRSAYLDWCKKYGKEPDESRFSTFSKNFLVMETYAKDSGKEMVLNEYADLTAEEYKKMTKPKVAKAEVVDEMRDEDREEEERRREEERERRRAELEAAEKKRQEYKAELVKKQLEARKQAEEEEAERRAQIEKERVARQQAQEKEMARMAEQRAAEAIAAAKAAAEAEAKRAAERRALEAKAAELARQKAREWERKQAQAKDAPARPTMSMGRKAVESYKPIEVELKLFPAPAPTKKTPKSFSPFSALMPSSSSPATKPIAKKPSQMSTKKSAASSPLGALFGGLTTTSAPPKPAPKAIAKPTPAKKAAPTGSGFSFFGSAAPKKPPAVAPVPAPAPAPAVKKSSPSIFSAFSAPEPKPKPSPSLPVIKTPPQKQSPFSFFGASSPPAAKKPELKKPSPKVENKPGTLSLLFGGESLKKKETPVPNRPGTLNIFGANKPAPKKAPKIPNRSGTISLFNSTPKKKPEPSAQPTKAASSSFSFFGGPKVEPKAASAPNLPTLSRWTQNPDGSITGIISNSPNFRNGTKITTSPVMRGAKAGSTIRTGSGSQYLLK